MKAEELMLGDWVKMYNGKGEYIDDTRVDINTLYTFCQDGQNVLRLEPIPLTSEILKKNGFKNISVVTIGTPKNRWVSDDTRTEITIWMDDTLPMEIVKNVYYEDEVAYTLPFPGTVSQLQHVLRLCGITLNIEI